GICLAVTGARLSPTTCVDDGTSPIQTLHINDDGLMLTAITDGDASVMLRGGQGGNNYNNNLKCVVPPPPPVTGDNGEYDDEVEKVSLNGCMVNTPSEVTKSSQRVTMIPTTDHAASPDGGNGSVMLLQTDSPKQGQQKKTGSLSCLSGNVALQQCLDAADGNTPILYTCYGEEEYNIGQQFIYDKDRGTLMNAKTYKCLDLHTESQHDLIESPPFIQTSSTQCHQQHEGDDGHHPSVVWDEYLPFVPLETRLYASSPAAATDKNNDTP
ncbi:hypothetical protein FOZ62_003322, partial [Perkinsus olseni]